MVTDLIYDTLLTISIGLQEKIKIRVNLSFSTQAMKAIFGTSTKILGLLLHLLRKSMELSLSLESIAISAKVILLMKTKLLREIKLCI